MTEINGGPDLFINKGSTINLTCIVKYAPEPPPAVIWKHNRDVSISATRPTTQVGRGFFIPISAYTSTVETQRDVSPFSRLFFCIFQDINFDSPRGGISLVTEKGVLTSSRLLVQKAIASDSGLYTCEPSNANPASVRVHILNGRCRLHHGGNSRMLIRRHGWF